MAKTKALEDMKFQEVVEHLNTLRTRRHYASMKGFTLMVGQIDLEIEKAEARYYEILDSEKHEYDKRHGLEEPEDNHIIFDSSDADKDD